MGSEPGGTQKTKSTRHKERPTHQFHSRLRHSVRPIGHLRATRAIHQDPTPLAGVGESDLWLTRGPAAHLPNLPRNDARSTQPGWTRKREGVRVKGPRPTVGTNLPVCPPAACASSTTPPLGSPQRPQTRAPKGPRRFPQSRVHAPLTGCRSWLGGGLPGVSLRSTPGSFL